MAKTANIRYGGRDFTSVLFTVVRAIHEEKLGGGGATLRYNVEVKLDSNTPVTGLSWNDMRGTANTALSPLADAEAQMVVALRNDSASNITDA